MTFRFTAALAVAISAFAAQAIPAFAESGWVVAKGVVNTGTLDSAIGDYGFMTRSAIATKIFATCKMDDLCEARVKANKDDFITKVDTVKRLKAAD